MKLIAKKAFSWAHKGVRVEEFDKGQEIETDDEDLIETAAREGWAEGDKKVAKSAPEQQAKQGAPESK